MNDLKELGKLLKEYPVIIVSMKAKPIIDIAVAVDDFKDILSFEKELKDDGFYYRPDAQASVKNQLLFACGSYYDGSGDLQTHFIHVVLTNSMDWINYINFRNYLNSTPSAAKEYENLKVSLALQVPVDSGREEYLKGKHDFIVCTLRKALVKEILVMANRLQLPEAVLTPLAAAANTLSDELPIGQLAESDTADLAWQTITGRIPGWREDNGMAQLAAMLAAVCRTEERYRQRGISEKVFLPTMDCFQRFLEETKARTGQWAFDRGFWTWRQTGGLLFRLGTLEFEYRKAGPGPWPEGLEAESPVLSVHIPSDAILKRENSTDLIAWPNVFSSVRCCSPLVCSSWILALALDGLLPENSGIRCFSGDYQIYDIDEEDQEFYEWLFGGYKPLGDLPEHTSLQRAVKARLTAGGGLGMARGVLNCKIGCIWNRNGGRGFL